LQFQDAISQLIHHPEYNSTLILRSEVIEDSVTEFPDIVPALEGLQPVRNIRRRLLPRRPTRDAGLEQHCTLYAPSSPHPTDVDALHPIVALVLTPILPPNDVLPYYHPTVTHLAFRFVAPTTSSSTSPITATATVAALRIEAVPLPGTSLDPGARLYRTCLSLLETLHRYGWGALTHYKKRVAHDVLVPRETYQDLYLVMRERYKHLVNNWREVTDPLKHVFEVRRALHFPLPTGVPLKLHIHIHITQHSGHRHRDVPHAPLERYLRSRNHPSRFSRCRHRCAEHNWGTGGRGTLASLAAPSGRFRRSGLR
jgi:tRNASer (uridine44-2'-O)-methyltransferase